MKKSTWLWLFATCIAIASMYPAISLLDNYAQSPPEGKALIGLFVSFLIFGLDICVLLWVFVLRRAVRKELLKDHLQNKITGTMTKSEAIEQMKAGQKLTHRYFTDNEWVTSNENGTILTLEDGVRFSNYEFWAWRTDESWDSDWEIWKDRA